MKARKEELWMSNYEIPYWKKYTLSIEEAAAYFRIGEGNFAIWLQRIQKQIIFFGMAIVYRLKESALRHL